jgi:iron(III) transport system permease protein
VSRWRLAVAVLLSLLIGVPLLLPFLDLCRHPSAWHAWREADRFALLARNTLLLLGGVLLLAVPAGVAGAVLLYRTDLPWRRAFRFATILTLFVPLPLFASGWQAALGTGGWLPLVAWSTPPPDDPEVSAVRPLPWKPWAQGLPAAVWVHAVAGLPWVVLLVGQGLRWVERDLEEDALTDAGPGRVLWWVTLRRALPAVGAAALWVALQTATEISVTDMMKVRTFAEEVYNQLVAPDAADPTEPESAALARAVSVSLPGVLLTMGLILLAVRRWERRLPPLETRMEPRLFRLGRWRWPSVVGVLLAAGLLAGVPVASLVWKAGLTGTPLAWSPGAVAHAVGNEVHVSGWTLGESLGLAALAGGLCALLALVACWLAVGSWWFRTVLLGLLAAAWALPGPVIGLGLKDAILILRDVGPPVVGKLLYYGPSPLPLLWAYLVRFFPCAVALLWPVVRLVPRELRDAARVDGAGPVQEFRHLIWPLTALSALAAGLAVAVLSLGELSASKLAETPGTWNFTHEVFNKMHYGVTRDLAALCLLLLAVVVLGGVAVAVLGRLWGSSPLNPERWAARRGGVEGVGSLPETRGASLESGYGPGR